MDATYTEPTTTAVPLSYAILSLPSKAVMRNKGYDPEQIMINGSETHPLATWKTFSLPPNTTYAAAMAALQEANKRPWGPLKARLTFTDGMQEMFARSDPGRPASFALQKTYNPNDVYRNETLSRSTARRAKLQPRLLPLVDSAGHHNNPRLPSSFAPEVLYRDCPPPVVSQAGYGFTPMSHNAFLLKPSDPPQGIRDVRSGVMHHASTFRPRSYRRDGPANSRHCHCAEVFQVGDYTLDIARAGDAIDSHNTLTKKDFTASGTLKPNSTVVGRRHAKAPRFACTSSQPEATTVSSAGAAEEVAQSTAP